MKIKIRSLTKEFDDQTIEIEGYQEELQCIAVIDNQCAPASLNCFVGTMEGRLLLYTRSWIRGNIEKLHDQPGEGAVTQVKYQYGLVIWSTPKKIRVIHYKRNKQKICMIPVPEANPEIPSYIPPHMYVSNLTMPKLALKINHEKASRIADPNVELYIGWLNNIKKVNIEYKDRNDKFDATTQFTKDLGSVFFAGLNIGLVEQKYTTLEFSYEPETDGQDQDEEQIQRKQKTPHLVCRLFGKWQETYNEPLSASGSIYHDLHYNAVQDVAVNDCFYIYSPEVIMKVNLPKTEDKVESLYIRRRYEEALEISKNAYSKPMLSKLQSSYFNQLLNLGKTEKLRELMIEFMGGDREKWMHWLTKIMQKKMLKSFLDLIPVDNSKEGAGGIQRQTALLPTSFYTKMYLHLARQADFSSLQSMVERTPEHVTNAETIINELKPFMEKEQHNHNPDLLEALFKLYQQIWAYENAFYAILKKKDPRVFSFLDQRQIDFPLSPNLGKLL